MSGVVFHSPTPEVSLVAATAKTVAALRAAANHRVHVTAIEFCGKGIVTTDTPIKVRLVRVTASSGTGTTLAAVKNNEGDNESVQAVCRHTFTIEPTVGDVLATWEIHPQLGLWLMLPLDQIIVVIGGNEIALEATAAQNQTVAAKFRFEE